MEFLQAEFKPQIFIDDQHLQVTPFRLLFHNRDDPADSIGRIAVAALAGRRAGGIVLLAFGVKRRGDIFNAFDGIFERTIHYFIAADR